MIEMNETSRSKGLAINPVFVGGIMKSGTSLLRALLGQHHRLFATFETHWFQDAVRFGWDNPSSERMQLILSLLKLNPNEYAALCERKRADTSREFIDIVMEYCCERAGKERWVEKTPGNILYWSLIQEIWSKPILIHVTREYKDMYTSWKVRRWKVKGGESLEKFLSSAKAAYEDIRPLLGKETESYLEVDYLDIVLKTEQTMRRILAHMGEEWDPICAAINVEQAGSERKQFRELLGRESSVLVSLSKPIFTSSIGQWRRFITEEEKTTIEKELGEFYEIYGDRWEDLPEVASEG
jgi:hypothetical protein